MNYLHNIVHTFMKHKGIRPFEIFQLSIVSNKTMDKQLAEYTKAISVFSKGYFSSSYDFCIDKSLNKTPDEKTKSLLLHGILQNIITITPVCRYAPSDGEPYYFLTKDNTARQVVWSYSLDDIARYTIGNCFRSEEEALHVDAEYYKKLLAAYKQEFSHYIQTAYHDAA